ncbi:MAG TPA: hypothetical protein PLX89_05960 [Verrucomicrobiota bacterium]|nr:hypothetical protein [Verrucomicrobiota bacterium]
METRSEFFVEGAWDGPFEDGRFLDALALMGTGARLGSNEVLFATPCHVLERLFTVRVSCRLFVSPSLAFVLAASGMELDPAYIPYQADLLRMIRRRQYHHGSIPAANGHSVCVHHYANLRVGPDLTVRVEPKKGPPDFGSFPEYRDFLVSRFRRVVENAGAPTRSARYEPISMLSTGYDSPACTVLAMEAGCREAVTFRTARSDWGGEQPVDSGRPIAERLGLAVQEFERLEALKQSDFPEAEFVAAGDLGQDFEIAALAHLLPGRLVVVGYHGDVVWDVNLKKVERDIHRYEAGGCCWTDFRFRTGFILAPLPFIGCLSHPSIQRISAAPEMAPWRVGGRYDRPIPRRLVEEKGVAREMFGQQKKSISILLNRHDAMLDRMTPASAEAFEAYYQANRKRRSTLRQAIYHLVFQVHRVSFPLLTRINSVLYQLHIPWYLPSLVPSRFAQCPGRPSFLVHWGLRTLKDRYQI